MRRKLLWTLSSFLFLITVSSLTAQNIFPGEPVQWVGQPNSYSTEPYNSDYRTLSYRKISTTDVNPTDGRGQWTTTINVQDEGGDIAPANMSGGAGEGWLLISGPVPNRFLNKWNFNGVGQAAVDGINAVTMQVGGEDMGLDMSTPGYYTFTMRDGGYVNTETYIGYTENAPVMISHTGTSFTSGQTTVSFTTSAAPSAGEIFYVRYSIGVNDFTSSTALVQATGENLAWSATLPAQSCGTTIYYYIFSSTMTLAELNGASESDRSLAALRYDDNGGANYSVEIDESAYVYYIDADNDGFGHWSQSVTSCDGAPEGYADNNLDCDDNLIVYEDADYDGFGDPNVFVPCIGNGVLNADDCDDNLLLYSDEDGDGFGSDTLVACDGVPNTDDCDDNLWYYLDVDNDGFGSNTLAACDGEGVLNNDDCDDNLLLFVDADGDGYGSETFAACEGVTNSDDCDDTNPELALQGGTYYQDLDGDGYGNPDIFVYECSQPEGWVLYGIDCDDNDPEIVGGTLYWRDLDGDGYGDPFWPKGSCTGEAPVGYVLPNTDCNDTNPAVNPGTPELLNGKDDNCNGIVDEGFPTMVSTIAATACGSTLTDIEQYVYSTIVAGADGYQWRLTTLTGPNAGQVQTRNTVLRNFKLPFLDNFAYDTTYKIEVAVIEGGFVFPYPETDCTITTPTPATSLGPCGITLSSMNQQLNALIVKYAPYYRFRITDPNNPADTQEIVRSVRSFRMTDITDFTVQSGTTYNVEVAAMNLDGTFLPYGDVCTVTTPALGRMMAPEFDAVAYPNPFASEIAIDLTVVGKDKVGIKVYDMAGRLLDNIYQEVAGNGTVFLGSQYPAGVYNVILTSGDETKAIRIIKR